MKRLDWISEVLEVMRGEKEVVAGGPDRSEFGAFAEEGLARRSLISEDEFLGMVGPNSLAGEIAVVERANQTVYGNRSSVSERVTRAADFEARISADVRAI